LKKKAFLMFERVQKRGRFLDMKKPANKPRLLDVYRRPGFRVRSRLDRYECTPPVFVITFDRRQKKRVVAGAEKPAKGRTIDVGTGRAILAVLTTRCIWTSRCGV
jgi:hypothetical protein